MIAELLLVVVGAAAAVQEPFAGGNSDTVAWLLGQRCSKCHSPGSDEPRASRRWADAGNLAATAADRDLIEPGDPDGSTLYAVLQDGEMPPPESGLPTLTQEEVALVGAWIKSGASSAGEQQTLEAGNVPAGETSSEGAVEASHGWMQSRFFRWVARFHPMLVHFPIALLVAALLAETLASLSRRGGLRTAATFCLALGAVSAVPTAALGWLLGVNSNHPLSALALHRWMGLSTAAVSLVVLWSSHKWPRWRWALMLLVAVMVGATGHAGASLSYGSSWLSWPR